MKNDTLVPGPREADKKAQKGQFTCGFFVMNLNMHKYDDFMNVYCDKKGNVRGRMEDVRHRIAVDAAIAEASEKKILGDVKPIGYF